MKVLVFGATGRVGAAVIEQAAAAGHSVTAFVRNPQKLANLPAGVAIAVGDVYKPETIDSAMAAGFDAVIVAVGADPLKPSTLVTDSARAIVVAAKKSGIKRYIGITGTAEMPKQTFFGKLATAILRLTPVGNAARDHDGAFDAVCESGLNWTLAGCPYIKDGETRGVYKTSMVFRGGYRIIHPGDVAHFLVGQLMDDQHFNQVVGIWY
jgi:putative NADH-flavin reductase